MNCHDAREYFSGWLDEALTAEERGALASHLAQCRDCQRELDRVRETVGLLQRVERPRAPVGFVDRVLEAARPTPWHRRLLQHLFLPLSVKLPAEAAAVLLVATLAVYVFQRTPELQQAARQEAPQPAYRAEPPAAPVPRPGPREEAAPSAPQGGPSKPQPSIRAKAGPAVEDARVPSPEEAAKSKAPSAPPPAPAPAPSTSLEAKREPGVERAATPRAAEPALTQPGLAPAPLGRADSAREGGARRATPSTAEPPSAMRQLPSADVVGRLAVKDREAAERALVELLARSQGAEISRRDESGATVVDLVVPRASYAEFSQGLARIGSWLPEAEPSELPSRVRLTLRLTE